MEVNSSISDLMREWLTEGKDRDTKKAKGLAPSSNVFQPRPERLGLGATPHPSLVQPCAVNKLRRNINKRIKSTSLHKVTVPNSCATFQHHGIDNDDDEGSRSLAFCSRVSAKTITSVLKIQKKRKRIKNNKDNIILDNVHKDSTNSLAIAEENTPHVVNSDKMCKPKKWSSRLRYGLFRPQTNCTRLRWRRFIVKRIP